MNRELYERPCKLSIVIPCFNEEKTLKRCVEKVLAIADVYLSLEIIIVDDCSKDSSLEIAKNLEAQHREITVLHHERNQGKGAALRTGFQEATGDFVAVQDADLEYNPQDLKRLLVPLRKGEADVVLGSRFLSIGSHRVLYFWHYVGNRVLTCLSNMFTDLNLTDMETCYKVFRREVIQSINLEEKRFGFEPEIVAKLAHKRLRIYEMGISYRGRTYEEGKKIGVKDGIRALYCIFRYNAHRAPLPIQFFFYLFIGGISALFNLFTFLILMSLGMNASLSASTAFITSAFLNYILCICLLFRHNAKWKSTAEMAIFVFVVSIIGIIDVKTTNLLLLWNFSPGLAKSLSSILCLIFNFLSRRFVVFPESASGPWAPQGDLQDIEEIDEEIPPLVSSDASASRE